jgi:hypothetical protein
VFVRKRIWIIIGEGTVLINSLMFHTEEEIKKER